MQSKLPVALTETEKAEQAKVARKYDEALKQRIAEKHAKECEARQMPAWMLGGFKMNGTLQGRS